MTRADPAAQTVAASIHAGVGHGGPAVPGVRASGRAMALDRLALLALPALLALAAPAPSTAEVDVAIERVDPEAAEFEQATAQLRAAEWVDRLTGVYALQRQGAGAAPAAGPLAALLGDENGLVRFEAAEALARIGAPAVPALLAPLSSDQADVRALAARTLGRIGLDATPALAALHAAATDDDPDVRDAAGFAVTVIDPQGVRGWIWKFGFEIGDEPYGVPALLAAVAGLFLVSMIPPLLRRRHGPTRTADRADGPGEASPGSAHPGDEDEEHGDEDPEEGDGDVGGDVAGGGDGDGDEEDAIAASSGVASTASPRATTPGSARTVRARDLPPPQGIPHAVAGLAAIAVGGLVVFLSALKSDIDPAERHGMYHFAALFALFGYLFARVGFRGAWIERRAKARRRRSGENWQRDRDWSRDGTGPIRAERVLPNLVALLLWVAFLAPFHTVWRLPFPAWWGAWIVLAIFDAIAVAILVATARRVWRRLRAGRCFLRWQGAPVRPGGTFSARFESARDLSGAEPLKATLRCLRDRSENRVIGDEAAADADEILTDTRSFPVHARPEGGSWAQISFAVPATAPGTDSFARRPTRWVVTVEIPTAGPDFRTTFPVPIYR